MSVKCRGLRCYTLIAIILFWSIWIESPHEAEGVQPGKDAIQSVIIEIDPQPPINLSSRGVNVTVRFGEDMNTSIQPNVTSGLPPDYNNLTFSGTWKNSTTWVGNATYPVKILDGVHRIKVSNAKNASGSTLPDTYSSDFIVDTEPPTSTVEALPRFITVKQFKVFVGCWDRTSGVHSVSLWYNFNKTGWTHYSTDTVPPFEWDFMPGQEGLYEFGSIAIDNASNKESLPVSNESWTIVDYTPPVSKVQPIGKVVHQWNITVNATAYDDNGVTMVELWFSKDGGPWVLYGRDSTPPWSWDMNVSSEGSGKYELSTRAVDQASLYEDLHETNDTWVYFDIEAPDTHVEDLPSKYVNTRSFTLKINLGHNPWMVNHTEVWYNNSTGWRLAGNTSGTEFIFNASSDGVYEFFSVGVTLAGEREHQPPVNDTWVIVDTQIPEVVSYPANGTSNIPLTSLIYLNFSEPVIFDTQNELTISPRISYTVSKKPAQTVITPSNPLTPLTRYTVTVKGHDYAGNAFFYSFSFTTKHASPPRISSTYPRQGASVLSFTSLYLNFTEKMNPHMTVAGVHIISGGTASLKDPRWTTEKSLVFKVVSAGIGSYVVVIDATYATSQDGIRLDGNGDGHPGDNYTLIFSVVEPPPQKGSILGITKDMRGNALPHVEIRLSRNGTVILNTTSGYNGEFEITDLEPGRYHLEAAKEKFRPAETDVDVSAGKVSYITLTLEFKAEVGIEGYAAFLVVAIVLLIAGAYALKENLKDKLVLFKKHKKKRKKATPQKERLAVTAKPVDSGILLEWKPVECDGYSLYVSDDGKRFTHLVEIPKRMNSYIHETIRPGRTMWYRVDVRYGERIVRGDPVKVSLPSP